MRHPHLLFNPAPLTLAIALAISAPGLVHAQAAATDKPVAISIAAQPLDAALNELAAATGVPVAFSPTLVAGKKAPAVKGNLTPREAVNQLLSGSGLVATQEGGSMVIKAARSPGEQGATLPAVTVKASAMPHPDGSAASGYRVENASVGALGEKSLKDTPYSIEVYSRELMDNKQARSLADLTKGDASIGLLPDKTFARHQVNIRGLQQDSNSGNKLDGMNYSMPFGPNELPLELMEHVEVLKGAGGFLYGFGAPGGIINYVLKRPTDDPLRSLSTQVTDSGLALIHGDVGGRFGTDKAFGYRVNLAHEDGESYVKDNNSRRTAGSIALDWRITPDLVWRIDALAEHHLRTAGYFGVTPSAAGASDWSGNAEPPAPIDGSERIAPKWGRTYTEYETYGTDLSWRITPDWKLSLAYRTTEFGQEVKHPAYFFANAQGDYEIFAENFSRRFEDQHAQALLSGKLSTGPVHHDLTFGVSRTKSDDLISSRYETTFLGPGNLASPADFADPFANNVSLGEARSPFNLARRHEIFASDTLHLGADWDLIIGLRRAHLQQSSSWDTAFDKSATTPTLAAIFRPMQGLSLYGSYIEALEKGATAPTTAANAGELFPPLVSKQYEVGAKAEGREWAATAALFQLKKGLTYTTPDNVFTQNGEARYQGLELNGKFRLSQQWLVNASAMWLDATNQKTDGGALDGKRIRGTAREQASVYGEYRVTGLPLTLTAGTRYVGKRPVDDNGRWQVGSVTLFDAGARYETKWGNNPVTLRLNIDNLADKAYWITWPAQTTLIQGAPRTIKIGAQVYF